MLRNILPSQKKIILDDCRNALNGADFAALRGKRILITGATGLLGQYLAGILASFNDKNNLSCTIDCVSLHGGNAFLKYFKKNGIRTLKKDLAKPFTLPQKYDYIFHAGGYGQPAKFMHDPLGAVSVNISATKHLLEHYLRPMGTFVFFSSADIYGDVSPSIRKIPETYRGNISTIAPRAFYGESKRLGEAMVAAMADQGKIRGRIVRISHVYGPGVQYSDSRVMSDFIRKAFEKKMITLLDDGRAVKTYGYVADVAQMILFAALHGKEMVYNVGGTDTMSIKELADAIAYMCGAKVEMPKAKATNLHIGSDPRFIRLDLTKIKKEMKRIPHTPFQKGLRNSIEWFRGL